MSVNGDKVQDLRSVRKNILCLKPLHVICHYLGLVPKITSRDLDDGGDGKKTYAILICLVHLGIYGLSAAAKFVVIAHLLDGKMRLLDIVLDFSMMVAVILFVMNTNVVQRMNFLKFLRCFCKLDEEMNTLKSEVPGCVRFYVELVLVHAYFVAYYSYYSYTWITSLGFYVFKFYMLRDLQIYTILMFALLVRYYALSIKYRYETLNQAILRVKDVETLQAQNEHQIHQIQINKTWDIKKIRKVYTQISSLVDDYNDLFGTCFIAIYVNIVVIFLQPINIAIIYGLKGKELGGATFGWELVLLCLIWGALSFVIGWLIFSACDQSASEASKIPKTCYKVMQDLTTDAKDFVLNEELKDFSQHAVNRSPQFTAAGFYTINYGVVFTLIGSISSYLIVLIQMNSQN